MAITVEDGSGVPSANSVVTVAETVIFLGDRGITLDGDAYGPFLLLAMDQLRMADYCGFKYYSVNEIPFPRSNVYDLRGEAYGTAVVPEPFKRAQMWLAHYISLGSDPGAVPTPEIRREKVDVIETEYAASEGDTTQLTIYDFPNVFMELEHLVAPAGRISSA